MVFTYSHSSSLYTVTDHLHIQSQISFFEGDNLFFSTDLNISEDTKSLTNEIWEYKYLNKGNKGVKSKHYLSAIRRYNSNRNKQSVALIPRVWDHNTVDFISLILVSSINLFS